MCKWEHFINWGSRYLHGSLEAMLPPALHQVQMGTTIICYRPATQGLMKRRTSMCLAFRRNGVRLRLCYMERIENSFLICSRTHSATGKGALARGLWVFTATPRDWLRWLYRSHEHFCLWLAAAVSAVMIRSSLNHPQLWWCMYIQKH